MNGRYRPDMDEPAGTDGAGGVPTPASDAPWAMQLVARMERVAPPSVTALDEAAGLAVLALLSDQRAATDGPWHAAVTSWHDGRIRKIVRRARGAPWERATAVDGVTVRHRGAEVRALVPCPTDQVPGDIAKLQLSGVTLEDPDRSTAPPVSTPTAAQERASVRVTIAVNPALTMSPGKEAAQCAHAAQVAWLDMGDERRIAWTRAGHPLYVVHPSDAGWGELVSTAQVHIRDAGFTEVPPDSNTTVARW